MYINIKIKDVLCKLGSYNKIVLKISNITNKLIKATFLHPLFEKKKDQSTYNLNHIMYKRTWCGKYFLHITRINIWSAYYTFYISYTKKSIWSNTVYIRRREFKAIQSLKRWLWSQRALFINQPRIDGLRRQDGRGYARIMRFRERKKEKSRERKFTFRRAESGRLMPLLEAGDVCACSGEWQRRRRDGCGIFGARHQCDIAIRLIRAGHHRRPVVRMAIKRGRTVHHVLHVNVHSKNVSGSDRENSSSPWLFADGNYFSIKKDGAKLDLRQSLFFLREFDMFFFLSHSIEIDWNLSARVAFSKNFLGDKRVR